MLRRFILLFGLIISINAFASTKILFLGDSLTEGLGVDEEKTFPRLVEKSLREKGKDVTVINGGISGSTSASGLSRLKWHLKKPLDVIVLELGANDGLRGIDVKETDKNLREIIKLAKDKKTKILLLGLLMPPNYGKKYTNDFQKMYKKIAADTKVPFLPFLLEGIAGVKEMNLKDGVHPNEKGHEKLAKSVSNFVEKNL